MCLFSIKAIARHCEPLQSGASLKLLALGKSRGYSMLKHVHKANIWTNVCADTLPIKDNWKNYNCWYVSKCECQLMFIIYHDRFVTQHPTLQKDIQWCLSASPIIKITQSAPCTVAGSDDSDIISIHFILESFLYEKSQVVTTRWVPAPPSKARAIRTALQRCHGANSADPPAMKIRKPNVQRLHRRLEKCSKKKCLCKILLSWIALKKWTSCPLCTC